MVDFNRMLGLARQSAFPEMLPAKKITLDEKYSNLVVNVNLSLANLFTKIQAKAPKAELL